MALRSQWRGRSALTLVSALALTACVGPDAERRQVPITIETAIIRDGGPAGVDVAGYAAFWNHGAAATIVSAECTCAERVELHVITRRGNEVSMDTDWPLPLPEGAFVEVKPGSPRHLMLTGIRAPIGVGDQVALHFILSDGRTIEGLFTAVNDSAAGWAARQKPTGS